MRKCSQSSLFKVSIWEEYYALLRALLVERDQWELLDWLIDCRERIKQLWYGHSLSIHAVVDALVDEGVDPGAIC